MSDKLLKEKYELEDLREKVGEELIVKQRRTKDLTDQVEKLR
jgi:hypothetical protein